jgi:serine/threonine-protein kinase RIO1
MIDLQLLEDQQSVNEDFAMPSTLLATDIEAVVEFFSHRLTRMKDTKKAAKPGD